MIEAIYLTMLLCAGAWVVDFIVDKIMGTL